MSLVVATDEGTILYFSRQYDRAIAQFQAVLEMQPQFPAAHMVVFAYFQKGMFSEALRDVDSWSKPEDLPWNLMIRVEAYQQSGRFREARQALGELLDLSRRQQMDPAPIIYAYVALGEDEEAYAWLEKGFRQHSTAVRTLKVDPFYDRLRSQPRFQHLLERANFNH